MIRGPQIGIPQRLDLLRSAATLGLLASVLLTPKLWFTTHLFPAAGPPQWSSAINPASLYLGIAACITLAGSLIFRWHRLLLLVALLCLGALVAADLNRLTHWLFVYGIISVVIIFFNGRVDDPNRYTSYFIILQIAVCSFYFYTGLHQLQGRFISQELAPALEPLRALFSDRQFAFALKLGWIVPAGFIFVAVSLLIPPARYLGITIALFLHGALLLLLWPLRAGDITGYLLNIFMMAALILLFSGRTRQRYYSPVFLFQRPAFYLVLAACCVMPAFNNSGRWPDALSANIYSGNRRSVTIVVPVSTYLRVPLFVKNFCLPARDGIVLDHRAWAMYELGVPCSDEEMILQAVLNQLEFWNRGDLDGTRVAIAPKQPLFRIAR